MFVSDPSTGWTVSHEYENFVVIISILLWYNYQKISEKKQRKQKSFWYSNSILSISGILFLFPLLNQLVQCQSTFSPSQQKKLTNYQASRFLRIKVWWCSVIGETLTSQTGSQRQRIIFNTFHFLLPLKSWRPLYDGNVKPMKDDLLNFFFIQFLCIPTNEMSTNPPKILHKKINFFARYTYKHTFSKRISERCMKTSWRIGSRKGSQKAGIQKKSQYIFILHMEHMPLLMLLLFMYATRVAAFSFSSGNATTFFDSLSQSFQFFL